MKKTVSNKEIFERRDFMIDACRELGRSAWRAINSYGDFAVELKADDTPVTSIDKMLNEEFIARVEYEFPDDLVWGEEQGNSEKGDLSLAEDRWLWVIDPIDGTKGFIRDYQNKYFNRSTTTVIVAGFAPGEKQPAISMISNPFNDQPSELLADPSGAYYSVGGNTMKKVEFTGRVESLEEVQRYDKNFWPGADPRIDKIDSLMPYARRTNHALGYAAVVLGDYDLGVFPGLSSAHDVAAAAHIIHTSGGAVRSMDGNHYEDLDWRLPVNGVLATATENLADDFLDKFNNIT